MLQHEICHLRNMSKIPMNMNVSIPSHRISPSSGKSHNENHYYEETIILRNELENMRVNLDNIMSRNHDSVCRYIVELLNDVCTQEFMDCYINTHNIKNIKRHKQRRIYETYITVVKSRPLKGSRYCRIRHRPRPWRP